MKATRLATLSLICAATASLIHAGTTTLLPPFLPAVDAAPDAPPLTVTSAGLTLPVVFTNDTDRVFWDIQLSARIPKTATSLEIVISCPDSAPIRSLSLHLRSGPGWYGCVLPVPTRPRQTIFLPLGLFQPEDDPADLRKASALRLSAWQRSAGTASITLHTVRARTDTVAVIRATELSAPNEANLAAMLADRCARLLAKAGISYAVLDDSFDRLDNFSLLFLPYAPAIPPKQVARLERFVKSGGRLIVFYNPLQPLGAIVGVSPGPWQGVQPGQEWTAMACDTNLLPGAAARVPHTTNGVLPPFSAGMEGSITVARLIDDTGRVTDIPACAVSGRGAWFAHVPPLATPTAVSLLRAVLARLDPAVVSTAPPLSGSAPNIARRPGEIRAAWHTGPASRHPQGWAGLMPLLASNAVNTLFIHWQNAGQNRFTQNQQSDSPLKAVAAGKQHNVSIHAWVTCWNLDGLPADQIARLSQEGRLMRAADGRELPWLCPSIPENRELLINGMRSLLKLGVDGIHLDYVRYPERAGCYAPATHRAFEKYLGASVTNWPADVLADGQQTEAFDAFRKKVISDFVRQARDAVRVQKEEVFFTAAVFPTPAAAAVCGQEWPEWLRQGLVDALCPMIYTEDPQVFAALLDEGLRSLPPDKANLIPGIGVSADESQVDAAIAARQISVIRARGLPGFAFFALDDALLYQTLPALFAD